MVHKKPSSRNETAIMHDREDAGHASCCPVTSSPQKRQASIKQTDTITANFPAGIARPALRALVAAGFSHLEQLVTISKDELAQLHGMGPKAIEALRAGLLSRGLDFRKSPP